MNQAMAVIDPHEQSQLDHVNAQLKQEQVRGAHLLAATTLQTIPPMHRPVVTSVHIDPDPKNKEVYPQKGGGLSLSAIAFKKIADAMGIQWVPDECGRMDDGTDPDYVWYRMSGLVKALDGTWRKIIGDKEIRMSVIREELTDSKRKKAEDYLNDPKDGPEFRKAFPDTEAWVQEQVRQEALQIKKHILSRAQSGALARATKSIGIRETYTPAELQKPFVFPKLVFTPDPSNPQDRAFLLAQGAGAINQLYKPEQPATAAQPSMTALPPGQAPREVAFLPPPDEPREQRGALPTPEESQRADFLASEPNAQAEILQALMKRKAYAGKIQGELSKWKAQDRTAFFDRLVLMADVSGAPAALPFE
jgi:hypothetical protein